MTEISLADEGVHAEIVNGVLTIVVEKHAACHPDNARREVPAERELPSDPVAEAWYAADCPPVR